MGVIMAPGDNHHPGQTLGSGVCVTNDVTRHHRGSGGHRAPPASETNNTAANIEMYFEVSQIHKLDS